MLLPWVTSHFPFSDQFPKEQLRLGMSTGDRWGLPSKVGSPSTERAELPQTPPATLTSARQPKSFWVCPGCTGGGDFASSLE